jgi:hypothetical protein
MLLYACFPPPVEQVCEQAGDVLFIPEGYWHQVDSSADTIAVNFWFESEVSRRLLDPALSDFYLTRLLQNAVALQKERLLESITRREGTVSESPHPEVCLEQREALCWLDTLSAPFTFQVYHKRGSMIYRDQEKGYLAMKPSPSTDF